MRVVLGVAYNGAEFYGWQRQLDVRDTIQEKLEAALTFVADHPVDVICAGRTDRGVHALGQIVHFDTEAERPLHAWVMGCNSHLPPAIRVRWATLVNDNFHARFAAIARRYRYVIYNQPVAPALLHNQVTTHYKLLNAEKMQAAAEFLIGEHDFTSYRAVQCQARSPVRIIEFLKVSRSNNFIFVDVKANGFLHHMVRNIVGVLLSIGEEQQEPVWADEILKAKDRTAGDVTAPPNGLYFMQAYYPAQFAIPTENIEPVFWG